MSKKVPTTQVVENWLIALPAWKSQLESMREQLTRIPGLTQKFELVAIYGQGQKNEAILQQVIRRLQLQNIDIPLLELKIDVLEAALSSLQPEERKYVEERYVLRLPSLVVMEKLGLTHRMYYQRRKRTLAQIYRFVGGKKSILFVEYEEELADQANIRVGSEEADQSEVNK